MPRKSSRSTMAPASKRPTTPLKKNQTVTSAPVAINNRIRGVGLSMTKTRPHPVTGLPGVRIVGNQQLTTVYTSTGSTSCLSTGASPAYPMTNFITSDVRGFSMNPRALYNALGSKSQTFSQYVIRSMTFNYRTESATTLTGSIAMAIVRDPVAYNDIGGNINFYASVKSFEESVSGPLRDNCSLTYKYPGTSLWFLDSPGSTVAQSPGYGNITTAGYNALQRQQQQFVFVVTGDDTYTSSVKTGYIDIHYDIEFYGEVTSSYFSYLGMPKSHEAQVLSYMRTEFVSYFSSNPDLFKVMIEKTWTDKKKPHPLRHVLTDYLGIHTNTPTNSPLLKYVTPLEEECKDYFMI